MKKVSSIYGSIKPKNKQKMGGSTIIDIPACLDVLFVLLWLFSICARPTIISTIHLLIFGIYVIFGGIIIYETDAKVKLHFFKYSINSTPYLQPQKNQVIIILFTNPFQMHLFIETPSLLIHNKNNHDCILL